MVRPDVTELFALGEKADHLLDIHLDFPGAAGLRPLDLKGGTGPVVDVFLESRVACDHLFGGLADQLTARKRITHTIVAHSSTIA